MLVVAERQCNRNPPWMRYLPTGTTIGCLLLQKKTGMGGTHNRHGRHRRKVQTPADLTIHIALDRLSGRRLPIDAIHAARPGRHGGNEKEPADDHDQGEPVEHRRLRRVVHCVVAEIVVPVVVQGISFGCGRQRRT